jgi:4-hydroxybenzoate polyprenyltransferase
MRVRDYLSLVRFSHSVFALPFALQGAWLAAGARPKLPVLLLIVSCAVAARTAAMAFNRLVDRDVDAMNPRTQMRELPAGRLSARGVAALVVVASTIFLAAAFALNTLAGLLALPVLAVLFLYSFVKRFSALAHLVLGFALALAPLGAWIAVRGDFEGDLRPIVWLSAAVLTWVAGFDLIYACQDREFDRRAGLHSIPARYGIAFALRLSSVLHVGTVIALSMVAISAHLSLVYWIAILLTGVLLVWEHRLVSPSDLSRVDVAFFTINGWIGVGLFLGLVADRTWVGGGF